MLAYETLTTHLTLRRSLLTCRVAGGVEVKTAHRTATVFAQYPLDFDLSIGPPN
jgi:hypothetical protein